MSRRILLAVSSLEFGGLERRCVALAGELARRGETVGLVVGDGGGPLREQLAAEVDLLDLRQPRPFQRGGPPRLLAAIRRWRPTAFHGFSNVGVYFGLPAARLAGVPAVVATLGTPASSRSFSPAERLIQPALLSLAGGVTANGRDVLESYRRRAPWLRGRLHYLPNFLRPEQFAVRESNAVRSQVRAELGVADGEPMILLVGRLAPVKGTVHAVRAAGRLVERGIVARWFVAGEGPERAGLEAEIARLGLSDRVTLLGARGDVSRLLAAADRYCLSSLWEGLPNALLEAMAAGVPAIATRIAATAELIRPGATGWLAEPADAESLAAAIADSLADGSAARRRAAAAQALVRARFDRDRIVDGYLDLYRRLGAG